MTQTDIGIIGASGVYELDGLLHARVHDIATPFGRPSDAIRINPSSPSIAGPRS